MELIVDVNDARMISEETRDLGLVVVKATTLVSISPLEGTEQIENPY